MLCDIVVGVNPKLYSDPLTQVMMDISAASRSPPSVPFTYLPLPYSPRLLLPLSVYHYIVSHPMFLLPRQALHAHSYFPQFKDLSSNAQIYQGAILPLGDS